MRRTMGLLAAGIVHLAVVVWTAFPPSTPGLGVPTWHHNASLVVTLLAFLATGLVRTPNGRLWSHRAHLGIGVLAWTFLAVASGFVLLYLKQDLKDAGLKDWAKFWHIAWSWLALWYFAAHTTVNWPGFLRAARRHLQGIALGVFLLAMAGIVAAIPLTWSDAGGRLFTDPRYIPMTLWTWLAFLAPAYGVWWWTRIRPPTWSGTSVVAFVNVWLFPMTLLANVSGFPILYFGTKDTTLKYVAKYWHTWPSIAMTLLVFAHTVQWWPAVANHWRRVRR